VADLAEEEVEDAVVPQEEIKMEVSSKDKCSESPA
jgi:hypothetical protein